MDEQQRSDESGPERPGLVHRLREAIRRHSLVAAGIAAAVLLVVVGVPAYLALTGGPEDLGGICVDEAQIAAVEERAVHYEGEELPYMQYGVEDAIGVTEEVARLGTGAGFVDAEEGDPPFKGGLGFRAEWQSDFYSVDGTEYAYGASYWFPEDWYQGENPSTFDDRVIFQFAEGAGTAPTFSLHIDADDQRLFVRHRVGEGDFQYLWETPFETERWYDIAFQAKWSTSDDGYFRVYLDGEFEAEFRGRTLNETDRVYTKWGIYGQPTKLMIDEVSIVDGPYGLPLVSPSPIREVFDETGAEVRDQALRRCDAA